VLNWAEINQRFEHSEAGMHEPALAHR